MHKEETTFLDYTRSAEELRLFELNKKCREIAHEYEKFNIENGIYERFGELFLIEVKKGYNTTFTSNHLAKIIYDKKIELPKTYLIAAGKEDYEKCQSLRDICVNDTLSLGSYKSNYAWYTMWKIAKAYNGKHGCVVTATPNRDWRSSEMLKIKMDWSQDAVDCITGEKWVYESKQKSIGILTYWFLVSGVIFAIFTVLGVLLVMLNVIQNDFLVLYFLKFCLDAFVSGLYFHRF